MGSIIPAISAASIIEKVIIDRLMLDLDQKYLNYGFAKHKGYGNYHVVAKKLVKKMRVISLSIFL